MSCAVGTALGAWWVLTGYLHNSEEALLLLSHKERKQTTQGHKANEQWSQDWDLVVWSMLLLPHDRHSCRVLSLV